MERGFVKLWRKTLESGIISSPPACSLFIWLLLNASHKERQTVINGSIVTLKIGDVIYGRLHVSKTLGLSERQVRTALEVLKKLQIVTIQSTNRCSIISLINWDKYQNLRPADDQQSDQQTTSRRPADDQQTTTKQECIELRIKNENINTSAQAHKSARVNKFIQPTVEEVAAYCKERQNNIDAQHWHDYYTAQGWRLSNGRAMTDWKAAVRTWERRNSSRPTQQVFQKQCTRPGDFDMNRQREIANDILAEMEAEDALRSNAGKTTQDCGPYWHGSQLRQGIA